MTKTKQAQKEKSVSKVSEPIISKFIKDPDAIGEIYTNFKKIEEIKKVFRRLVKGNRKKNLKASILLRVIENIWDTSNQEVSFRNWTDNHYPELASKSWKINKAIRLCCDYLNGKPENNKNLFTFNSIYTEPEIFDEVFNMFNKVGEAQLIQLAKEKRDLWILEYVLDALMEADYKIKVSSLVFLFNKEGRAWRYVANNEFNLSALENEAELDYQKNQGKQIEQNAYINETFLPKN